MTVDEFVQVLVAEMEAEESTAFVEELLRDAKAALTSGKGTVASLTSSSVNGKSFQRAVELTPLQVINGCRQALKIYLNDGEDDDRVSSTRANFSGIDR